ncbi:MAG: hypothetical protein AB1779_06390 [Candidatus Thermoplasmatota archaeon]
MSLDTSNVSKALMIVGFVLFFIPFIAIPVGIFFGGRVLAFAPCTFALAFLGFAILFIAAILGGTGSLGRAWASPWYRGPTIPPVPYPREPRYEPAKGVIEITCPNCGAAPKHLSPYGMYDCEYCHTKYKV